MKHEKILILDFIKKNGTAFIDLSSDIISFLNCSSEYILCHDFTHLSLIKTLKNILEKNNIKFKIVENGTLIELLNKESISTILKEIFWTSHFVFIISKDNINIINYPSFKPNFFYNKAIKWYQNNFGLFTAIIEVCKDFNTIEIRSNNILEIIKILREKYSLDINYMDIRINLRNPGAMS